MIRFLPFVAVLIVAACSQPSSNSDSGTAGASPASASASFEMLTDEFTRGALALSPVYATQAGYHEHEGVALDERLDDYSAAGLDAQRRFYTGMRTRLDALGTSPLDREQQADLLIMTNNISLALLDLDTIQAYRHNPTIYVELVGNALYTPFVLNYAAADVRFRHITKRLEQVPALVEQAQANLVDAPEVWNRVAREENAGNIALIDQTLRRATPEPQRADYDRAADGALAALEDFTAFLENTLAKKTSDWRLGRDLYARKFALVLGIDKTPEQLLAEAEADLTATRMEMASLAAPKTVKQALDDIARDHATPETYMAEAKEALQQATAFVKEKDLVTLPGRSNLQVIDTPEFMRGIYGVGGFNPAPPLQPELGAFYWITPIPTTWPKSRIESKLREYNKYGIQQLTIHEAMPGHYVQLEIANDVQPKPRRLLRVLFANGPYVEGWGFYAQQLMSEQGYLNNSTALNLTWLKQKMRGLANTILDIRLQTLGMTEQQALDLMINETYQEREEATAKFQRAQLSSTQLTTYYAGLQGWLDARRRYQQRQGSNFSLKAFHDRALRESAVPLPELQTLLAP